MIETYFYTCLIIAITIFLIIKKFNKMGIILMLLYSFIALMSSLTIYKGNFRLMNITFLPYVFLIIIFIIVFSPFLSKTGDFSVKKLSLKLNAKYYFFAYIFIITSFISILFYLGHVKSLLITNDWNTNRAQLYEGTLIFNSNLYQYYSLQFSSYTRVFGLLLGFSILRNNDKRIIGWCCIVLGSISEILNAMYSSSRGSIVNLILLVFVMYLFFYDDLKESYRNIIVILTCLALSFVIPYVVKVTISRFSEYDALNSVVEYFGQPPIVFNYGVATMYKHAYGLYAFGKLFGDSTISQASLGGTWGSGFYTFVGWLFIDWGYFGTFVISVIISFTLKIIINKKNYSLSDLYIIFFIYHTLLQGAFVIGRSYIYNIVVSIFIYYFIKIFFDKYKFVIGRFTI